MPGMFSNKAKNTSSETPDRQPLTPVPESYEGDNHPYRGLENHGVKPTDKPEMPTEEYQAGAATLPIYEHHFEPEPEPIPVRVVAEGGTMIAARTYQVPIPTDGTSAQILPRMKNRKTAILQNGGNPVTLITDRNAQGWMGFTLPANAQFTVNAQTEMYATASAATTVSVYVEYGVEEEN